MKKTFITSGPGPRFTNFKVFRTEKCHETLLTTAFCLNMFLKGYPLEAKTAPKN